MKSGLDAMPLFLLDDLLKEYFTFYKERSFNNHALNNHLGTNDWHRIIVIKCWHVMPLMTSVTITWI